MKRRLLFASHCWPWPSDFGAAQRAAMVVEALVHDWDVTFFFAPQVFGRNDRDFALQHPVPLTTVTVIDEAVRCFSPLDWWGPAPDRLRRLLRPGLPRLARGWSTPAVLARLRDLRMNGSFDLVWATQTWAAEAATSAGFDRVICELWDVPSQWLRRDMALVGSYRSRWLHDLERERIARYERRLARRHAGVVVCKEEERSLVGGPAPNVYVVPNGAKLPNQTAAQEVTGRMLFVGRMSYGPNIDAVEFFHRDVLPLVRAQVPEASFRVIGADPPATVLATHDGVAMQVAGYADDLAREYGEAAMVVAPLRSGGGTKIKVIEALTHGRAVVATPVATEGLGLADGVNVAVGDTAQALAAACVRLLRDSGARTRLAEQGRAHVAGRFSWEAIGPTVRQVARLVAASTGVAA